MPEIIRIPLTGPNQERAAESTQKLIDMINAAGEAGFDGVVESAWRAARGQNRWIIAARNRSDLITKLAEFALDGTCVVNGQYRSGARRTTFVFSGMGPQWALMGRSLARSLPAFESRVLVIDKLLAEHHGASVWEELETYDAGDQLPTSLAQPGNFLIQAALHDVLIDEGVVPEAVIGHSAGEVASAYAAGIYSLPEAARVAVVRGRLQATLAGRGSMLALGLSVDEALDAIADLPGVSLAAVNDHQAVTVAGDSAQIAQLEQRMRDERVFAKLLRVEVPYHSPVMDEIAVELADQMAFIEPKRARLPIYSTVSGALSTGEEWGAPYWPRNVREPVFFARAVEAAMADGSRCFVEIAPHPVLSQSIDALAKNTNGVTVTPLLSRRDDEYTTMLTGLGKLALEGVGRPARTAAAPMTAPVRALQKLWDQDPWYDMDRMATPAADGVKLLGRRVADHNDEFDVELSTSDQPWIEGHAVQGLGAVVPATMWAELMALAVTVGECKSITLTDLTIVQGMPVFNNPAVVRLRVSGGVIRCYSRPLGDTSNWSLNAVASIGAPAAVSETPSPEATPPAGPVLDSDALYSLFRLKGLLYTGAFRNLTGVTLPPEGDGDRPLVAWGTIDAGRTFTEGHHAPWVLDAGLQLLIAAARDLGEAMYLPFRLGRVVLHRPIADGSPVLARAEVTTRTQHELVGSIQFFDASGLVLAELVDVACVRNSSDDAARMSYLDRNSYLMHGVTPDEVVERFTVVDDEDEVLDGGQFDLDDDLPLDDVDLAGEMPEVVLDEYLLPSHAEPVVALDRAAITLDTVPRAERCHLLWMVPNRARTQDAIDTFELVNQVGALNDPTLTLTLIGAPSQQWLFGLRRSATNAFGIPVRAVLVGPDTPADELDRWLAAVAEWEITLDGDVRLNRLESVGTDILLASTADVAECMTLSFDLPAPSRLDVALEPVRRPGPGEITIENHAVPLTWKDVGKAFGTIGTNALSTFAGQFLGLGAMGRVVAVGPDVPFAVGDLVCGSIRRPFRQRLTVNVRDEHIRPVSPDADPVVQLALSMPWLTTLAALDDVARIRAGETIFIQSGAGALGSVLCRHALASGCRVVTSVGTADKVAAVHELFGPEVEVVVARGAAIPGALLAAGHTAFDCIAAVVNGEARSLLFNLLRVRGRYIDLGKAGSADEMQLALAVDGNRSLARVDTDQIAAEDPEWFDDLITRALDKVRDESLHTPVTRYPVDQLPAAIAALARGETVGSLVVELSSDSGFDHVRRAAPVLDPDGIYVITGGYGGVGLMSAQWMASRGARTIVVTGRSGKVGERSRSLIGMLEAFGAEIRVVAADVSDRDATVGLLRELHAEKPIRGIMHAAGVIADGPFPEIDADRVERSFAAKGDGLLNLIDGLDGLEGAWDNLDFLLLTSSMSGALGVSLQGTYAAANTELDGWAAELRRRGVHACAMQLGPIEEGGMAADDERNARFFAANGLSMVSPRRLYGILDAAASTTAAVFLTAEVDWQRVGRSEPGNTNSSVIGHLVAAASGGGDQAELEVLLSMSQDDRTEVLTLTLLGLFTNALGVEDGAIDAEGSFADMGIDSLAVVEIQVGVNEILQHDVPLARLFLPDGTIGQLAARISEYLDEAVIDIDAKAGAAPAGPGA